MRLHWIRPGHVSNPYMRYEIFFCGIKKERYLVKALSEAGAALHAYFEQSLFLR